MATPPIPQPPPLSKPINAAGNSEQSRPYALGGIYSSICMPRRRKPCPSSTIMRETPLTEKRPQGTAMVFQGLVCGRGNRTCGHRRPFYFEESKHTAVELHPTTVEYLTQLLGGERSPAPARCPRMFMPPPPPPPTLSGCLGGV